MHLLILEGPVDTHPQLFNCALLNTPQLCSLPVGLVVTRPQPCRPLQSMRDVIHSSELGSSRVILEAGFNIACLMQRYQARDLIATEGRLPSGSAAHKVSAPCKVAIWTHNPAMQTSCQLFPCPSRAWTGGG